MQREKLCAAVLADAPAGWKAPGSAARWLLVVTVLAVTADAARAVEPPPPGLFRCRASGDARSAGYHVVGELRIDGANYSYESGYTAATTVRHTGTYRFVSEDATNGRLKFSTGGLAGGGDALWGGTSIFFRSNLCHFADGSAGAAPAAAPPVAAAPPNPYDQPLPSRTQPPDAATRAPLGPLRPFSSSQVLVPFPPAGAGANMTGRFCGTFINERAPVKWIEMELTINPGETFRGAVTFLDGSVPGGDFEGVRQGSQCQGSAPSGMSFAGECAGGIVSARIRIGADFGSFKVASATCR